MTDDRLAAGVDALGLGPDGTQLGELEAYLSELSKWNRVYNLTRVPEADWVSHHLIDSLSIAKYVTGDRLIDVGTGAGLPGIPLAIVFPQKRFTLLDSNGKKTRFLQQVRTRLGLENVEIAEVRAESFVGKFDHVTCRAFASLADISAKTAHLLHTEGSVLAMKGAISEEELASDVSPLAITDNISLEVPGLSSKSAERHLVMMKLA